MWCLISQKRRLQHFKKWTSIPTCEHGRAALLITPLNTTPLQIKMAEIRKGVLLWTLATLCTGIRSKNSTSKSSKSSYELIFKKMGGKKTSRLNLDGQQSTTFECLVISSECTFENNNSCQIFVWFPIQLTCNFIQTLWSACGKLIPDSQFTQLDLRKTDHALHGQEDVGVKAQIT